MSDLRTEVDRLARTPALLVGCDFDGVIAPIVDHPPDARPLPGFAACLSELAALPRTTVAVISGRSLESLRELLGPVPGIHMVGSHGSQWHHPGMRDQPRVPDPRADALEAAVTAVAGRFTGALVERKPDGVAFHYRHVAAAEQDAAVHHARNAASAFTGIRITPGKMVVEFSCSDEHKGAAFKRLRAACAATNALFLGDDVTDEDAFATLGPGDVGIAVGAPRRGATHLVPGPAEALGTLRMLHAARAAIAP